MAFVKPSRLSDFGQIAFKMLQIYCFTTAKKKLPM